MIRKYCFALALMFGLTYVAVPVMNAQEQGKKMENTPAMGTAETKAAPMEKKEMKKERKGKMKKHKMKGAMKEGQGMKTEGTMK